MDRNWDISENETVGSVITRVHADDAEGDDLKFSLDFATLSNSQFPQTNKNLPFRIDENGKVYLTESLLGRVSNFQMFYN